MTTIELLVSLGAGVVLLGPFLWLIYRAWKDQDPACPDGCPRTISEFWAAGEYCNQKSNSPNAMDLLFPYINKDGEYQTHAIGDVVPLIAINGDIIAFYRITDIRYQPSKHAWDDGKIYDLEYAHTKVFQPASIVNRTQNI